MKSLTLVSTLLLAAAALTTTAHAASIQLKQYGYDAGGPLTVEFDGTDNDASGAIEVGELTSFAAYFALPGGGSAMFSLADLGGDGFGYTSNADYFIKADNPDFSLYEYAWNGDYIAFVAEALGSNIWISGRPLVGATATPEPSTAALFAASALAVAVASRLRRRRFQ